MRSAGQRREKYSSGTSCMIASMRAARAGVTMFSPSLKVEPRQWLPTNDQAHHLPRRRDFVRLGAKLGQQQVGDGVEARIGGNQRAHSLQAVAGHRGGEFQGDRGNAPHRLAGWRM